ncbi:MAG TPA: cytochrome c, partial [Planctomycetota bacterium]|nr:cytochrome c [Planctomycetota bacterium]
ERATPKVLIGLAFTFAAVTLLVHSDEGARPPAEPLTVQALEGRGVWNRNNCNACHQIYGMGGYLGPDLTNSFSRRGPQHIRNVLEKGFGNMPDLGLGRAEIDQVVEYLHALDRTGTFPQRTWPPEGLPNR